MCSYIWLTNLSLSITLFLDSYESYVNPTKIKILQYNNICILCHTVHVCICISILSFEKRLLVKLSATIPKADKHTIQKLNQKNIIS